MNNGASLDALLNPAKLINIERELVDLRAQRDAGDSSAELLALIDKKEGVAYARAGVSSRCFLGGRRVR